MVPAVNKAKRLWLVNHTPKEIHHCHYPPSFSYSSTTFSLQLLWWIGLQCRYWSLCLGTIYTKTVYHYSVTIECQKSLLLMKIFDVTEIFLQVLTCYQQIFSKRLDGVVPWSSHWNAISLLVKLRMKCVPSDC